MDMMDILGGLLGHKKGSSGGGTDILKDILNRGRRTAPAPSAVEEEDDPAGIERSAKELEDLLHVAHGREASRQTGQTTQPRQQQESPFGVPADAGMEVESPYAAKPRDERSSSSQDFDGISQNEQALVMVRAMMNAAKADGRISADEQQNILNRFGNASAETVRFLREEMAKPLDVREFASSVPVGMENQVYSMSLLAIDVDTSAESAYLRDLAKALRISDQVRNQLDQQHGVGQSR